jgi:hypothetical protein
VAKTGENMPYLYHITTHNKLSDNKKVFDCYCQAQKYIKSILEANKKTLSNSDFLSSIRMVTINTDKVPNYEKLFPVIKVIFKINTIYHRM